MLRKIRIQRPSPAFAVATVALLVALAGVTWAAIPGPAGLIRGCYSRRSGQLRVINTSARAKCRHGEAELDWTETGRPGLRGHGGPRGLRGSTGPRGLTGPAGHAGPGGAQGPSNAFAVGQTAPVSLDASGREVLSLGLPPGTYVVSASVELANDDDGGGGKPETITCVMNAVAAAAGHRAAATATVPFLLGSTASETVPLDGTWSLAQADTLELSCSQQPHGVTSASGARIDAIQVATVSES